MLRHLESGDLFDVLEVLFSERRQIEGRPWVMLNIVESIDGATAIDGGASGLNDADDRQLFLALRAVADVVMNGAATVRAENLGALGDRKGWRWDQRATALLTCASNGHCWETSRSSSDSHAIETLPFSGDKRLQRLGHCL